MHARCGHVVDDNGILVVTDWKGDDRRMGSLPDKHLLAAGTPTFDDLLTANEIEPYTDAMIEEIARSGAMNGETKFASMFNDDQHSKGSCNGQSEAGIIGNARYRRGEPFVKLSGAYAYSLMNGGMDNGSALASALANVERYGVCRAELCAWDKIYPRLYDKAACDEDAKRFRGFQQYPVMTLRAAWTALCMGFDLGVAVHAGNNFMRLNAEGCAGVDSGPGNHAVRCDGIRWGANGPTGTGMNSWGLGYGKNGRMDLHEGHFRQTFGNHQFWVLPSTQDDQTDANKPPRLIVEARGPRLVPVAV